MSDLLYEEKTQVAMLPCGHRVCLTCLDNFVSLECHSCRKRMPEKALVFHRDFSAINDMSVLFQWHIASCPQEHNVELLKQLKALLNDGKITTSAFSVTINSVDNKGKLPIHNALDADWEYMTIALIDASAEMSRANNAGITPLQSAMKKRTKKVVLALIDAKTAIDLPDRKGNSPLHCAIKKNRDDVMFALIKGKANIEAVNSKGNRHLYVAVLHKDEKVFSALVESNADQHAVGSEGKTPYQLAWQHDRYAALKFLERNMPTRPPANLFFRFVASQELFDDWLSG